MSAAVSSTFFRRVATGLAASLALGALSAHAAPTPFPADFRSSQVVTPTRRSTSASAATGPPSC